MATILHALPLAVFLYDQTLFSCNEQALLAACPRHIQSLFNLIVDILMGIHVMVS